MTEAKQTQPFIEWWLDLNKALTRVGADEANYGEAGHWYRHGTSPDTSSALLIEERREDAAFCDSAGEDGECHSDR